VNVEAHAIEMAVSKHFKNILLIIAFTVLILDSLN